MADVRAIAKTYLSKILADLDKQADKQFWTDRDGKMYTDLCAEDLVGTKFKTIHEKIKANWDSGGFMTSCLSFVLTYAKRVGYQMQSPGGYMADFNVDTSLSNNPPSKGYAWVPFGGDKRPKYGDVVLFSHGHIALSLDVDGETWNTLESGQGGPAMGHDVLMKMTQTYSSRTHLGWVDLDLYFGPKPQPPAPQQNSTGGTTTGYLWLNKDNDVVHPDAPTGGGGRGSFTSAGPLRAEVNELDLPHPASPVARRVCVHWPFYGEAPPTKRGPDEDTDEDTDS